MKIQIDTKAKTVKFEGLIPLSEVVNVVKKLLPNSQWKEYSLDATAITNWYSDPIYPIYPYAPYIVTSETTGTNPEDLSV